MSVLRVVLVALLSAVVISETTFLRPKVRHVPELRDSYRVIAGSNLNFTNALYKVLSIKDGNIFFSPLSIQVILSLAAQGARGATQDEMISGLRLPQEQQTTRDGFRQLLKALRKNDGESVKIANKIYTDRAYSPTEEFVRIAQESFQSDGEKVDFQRDYDQVRQRINQWVESQTENKIQNLLAEGTLGTDTVMVLVNAVYFKGTWSTQFDPEKTKPSTFYVSPQVQRTVNMMQVKVVEKFGFKESEELNAKILEIPYEGSSMSLVIILPNERFGLREVEAKLATTEIRQLFKQMNTPEVHVKLPKFKLEQTIDLQDTLKQMGMNRMFSNSANFSGIATGPLKISKVVHKAFIEVNERGVEAAGSTAVVISTRGGRVPYITFAADHPFIFLLCNSEVNADTNDLSKSVVFMGRYWEPKR